MHGELPDLVNSKGWTDRDSANVIMQVIWIITVKQTLDFQQHWKSHVYAICQTICIFFQIYSYFWIQSLKMLMQDCAYRVRVIDALFRSKSLQQELLALGHHLLFVSGMSDQKYLRVKAEWDQFDSKYFGGAMQIFKDLLSLKKYYKRCTEYVAARQAYFHYPNGDKEIMDSKYVPFADTLLFDLSSERKLFDFRKMIDTRSGNNLVDYHLTIKAGSDAYNARNRRQFMLHSSTVVNRKGGALKEKTTNVNTFTDLKDNKLNVFAHYQEFGQDMTRWVATGIPDIQSKKTINIDLIFVRDSKELQLGVGAGGPTSKRRHVFNTSTQNDHAQYSTVHIPITTNAAMQSDLWEQTVSLLLQNARYKDVDRDCVEFHTDPKLQAALARCAAKMKGCFGDWNTFADLENTGLCALHVFRNPAHFLKYYFAVHARFILNDREKEIDRLKITNPSWKLADIEEHLPSWMQSRKQIEIHCKHHVGFDIKFADNIEDVSAANVKFDGGADCKRVLDNAKRWSACDVEDCGFEAFKSHACESNYREIGELLIFLIYPWRIMTWEQYKAWIDENLFNSRKFITAMHRFNVMWNELFGANSKSRYFSLTLDNGAYWLTKAYYLGFPAKMVFGGDNIEVCNKFFKIATAARSNNFKDTKSTRGKGGSQTLIDILVSKVFLKNEVHDRSGIIEKLCRKTLQDYRDNSQELKLSQELLDQLESTLNPNDLFAASLRESLRSFNLEQFTGTEPERRTKASELRITSIQTNDVITGNAKSIALAADGTSFIRFNISGLSLFLDICTPVGFETPITPVRIVVPVQFITHVALASKSVCFRVAHVSCVQLKDPLKKKATWKTTNSPIIMAAIGGMILNAQWKLCGTWSDTFSQCIVSEHEYLSTRVVTETEWAATARKASATEAKELDTSFKSTWRKWMVNPSSMKRNLDRELAEFFKEGKERKCFSCGVMIGIYDTKHYECVPERFRNINILNRRIRLLLSDPTRYRFVSAGDPKDDARFAYEDSEEGYAIWIIRMVLAEIYSHLLTLMHCNDDGDGAMGKMTFCKLVFGGREFINTEFKLDISMDTVLQHLSECCRIKTSCLIGRIYWKTDVLKDEECVAADKFVEILQRAMERAAAAWAFERVVEVLEPSANGRGLWLYDMIGQYLDEDEADNTTYAHLLSVPGVPTAPQTWFPTSDHDSDIAADTTYVHLNSSQSNEHSADATTSCGLRNPATPRRVLCYINAVIQGLFSIPQIRESYIERRDCFSPDTLSYHFGHLLHQMKSTPQSLSISITRFTDQLEKMFPRNNWTGRQEDAYIFFIPTLLEKLRVEADPMCSEFLLSSNWISMLTTWNDMQLNMYKQSKRMFRTDFERHYCGESSPQPHVMHCIDFEVEETFVDRSGDHPVLRKQTLSSLEECLSAFLRPHRYKKDPEAAITDPQRKISVDRGNCITKLPDILFFRVKRMDLALNVKRNDPIAFAAGLNANFLVYKHDGALSERNAFYPHEPTGAQHVYDLHCAMIHSANSGSLDSGHYTCVTRNADNVNWTLWNDTRCSTVSEMQLGEFFGSLRDLDKPSAYIFGYVRRRSGSLLFTERLVRDIGKASLNNVSSENEVFDIEDLVDDEVSEPEIVVHESDDDDGCTAVRRAGGHYSLRAKKRVNYHY